MRCSREWKERGRFLLRKIMPLRGTSKMDAFWGRWAPRGTLKAPLEAVLERGADFR